MILLMLLERVEAYPIRYLLYTHLSKYFSRYTSYHLSEWRKIQQDATAIAPTAYIVVQSAQEKNRTALHCNVLSELVLFSRFQDWFGISSFSSFDLLSYWTSLLLIINWEELNMKSEKTSSCLKSLNGH